MDEHNANEAELKSSNRKQDQDQHVPYENIPTYQCDPRGEMSEKEDKPMRGERLEGNTRLDKSERSRRGERSGVRKRSKARNCDHSRVSIRYGLNYIVCNRKYLMINNWIKIIGKERYVFKIDNWL